MSFIDIIKTKGIKLAINKYISDFGSLDSLDIDKSAKIIKGTILLKGESTAVNVHINNYRIENQSLFVFDSVTIDREWMQKLAERVIRERYTDKTFKIPEIVNPFVGLFI